MKKIISLILFQFLVLPLSASPVDSISTIYKDDEFASYCQVLVKASTENANDVIKYFNFGLENNFNSLFLWALKDLKIKGESDELISFKLNSAKYNNASKTLKSNGEVDIPGLITVPNIIVECKIKEIKDKKDNTEIKINLIYSNTFLKTMSATFSIHSVDDKSCLYKLETHTSFGWFFNMFITRKKYKEFAEWRLQKFLDNLRSEAEKREKL